MTSQTASVLIKKNKNLLNRISRVIRNNSEFRRPKRAGRRIPFHEKPIGGWITDLFMVFVFNFGNIILEQEGSRVHVLATIDSIGASVSNTSDSYYDVAFNSLRHVIGKDPIDELKILLERDGLTQSSSDEDIRRSRVFLDMVEDFQRVETSKFETVLKDDVFPNLKTRVNVLPLAFLYLDKKFNVLSLNFSDNNDAYTDWLSRSNRDTCAADYFCSEHTYVRKAIRLAAVGSVDFRIC